MSEPAELTLSFLRRRPSAAAAVLEGLAPEAAAAFLAGVPARIAAPVWSAMMPLDAGRCLALCPQDYAMAVLAAMPARDAAGVLRRMPEAVVRSLLARLPRRSAFALRLILRYPVTAVGAWMEPDTASIPVGVTVLEAWIRLRRDAVALERYLYVVERDQRRLVGRVASIDMLRAEGETLVERLVEPAPAAIAARDDVSAAVAQPAWRDCDPLPVIARDGAYLGLARHAVLCHAEQDALRAPMTAPLGDTLMELVEAYWAGLARLIEGPFSRGGSSARGHVRERE